MRRFLLLLRMLGASLVSLIVVIGLIWLSFWGARRNAGGTNTHLRWYMIASSPIQRGHRLSAENVSWQLGRIADDLRFLPKSSMAVGKYASVDIPAGTCLSSDNLTQFAAAAAPENGAVAPVEVKTENVCNLQPGMRLAFVQNKVVLPAAVGDLSQPNSGFLLLSITPSSHNPATTTLMVKVEPADRGLLAALGTDQWRPIVLGDIKIENKPVVAGEGKKRTRHRRQLGVK